MDYNEFEKSIYELYKKEIIKKFKDAKNKGRTITKAIDKITLYLSEIRNNSITYKNQTLLINCIYDINHRLNEYESPQLALNSIISNEIKDSFEKVSDRIIGLDNEKLKISFDDFVKELITYDCLGRIEQRVKLNSELYKIFYDNNDYKGFTLEYFEGHVVNSDLYRKVFAKFNPDTFIPIAILSKNVYDHPDYKIVYEALETNTNEIKKSIIKNNSSIDFETDEQALILNICLVDKNSIPLTEKVKLLISIGGIKDISIFTESSADNLFYQKVNNGIYRKGSAAKMIDLIDNILLKLKDEKLNMTRQTLKKHKSTLISEQNTAKKS